MKALKSELITESLYELKSLFSLYRNYVKSFPKANTGETKKEMKVVKQQILKQILNLKKTVKKMESEVAPRA